MENVTEIYLVRHGQSVANLENRMAGTYDTELTELGREQAKITANALKDIEASEIYSSDLKRARNTAEESAVLHKLPVNVCKELREIDMGEWEGLTFDDINRDYGEAYTITWKKNFGFFTSPAGESVDEVFERVNKKLLEIAKKNLGKKVFVFAHGAVIRIFFGKIMGLSQEQLASLPWATNASYSIAVYDGENFKPKEYSVDSFMTEEQRSYFKG